MAHRNIGKNKSWVLERAELHKKQNHVKMNKQGVKNASWNEQKLEQQDIFNNKEQRCICRRPSSCVKTPCLHFSLGRFFIKLLMEHDSPISVPQVNENDWVMFLFAIPAYSTGKAAMPRHWTVWIPTGQKLSSFFHGF